MQELITPVQFEPALDSLNQINKLYVGDKVHLSIDAMQGCKNPVGHGNPIIGKFIKEDNQGALCCHTVVKEITDYEFYYMLMTSLPLHRSYTFTQKVYGVMVRSSNRNPSTEYNFWATPDRNIIKILPHLIYTWLPFEGNTIWFSTKDDFTRGDIWIWGFY